MATISFDIGGVITQRPAEIGSLMAQLRKQGHRVIVVTAIGHGSIIPEGEPARQGFSHGRLYQLGVNLGKHYDDCFTTGDHGHEGLAGVATGHLKAQVLAREKADVHVDDRIQVLKGITTTLPALKTVHYTGQTSLLLEIQISDLLKA